TGIERQFCSGLQQVGCLCVQGEIPQRQRLLKDGDAWNQMKVFQDIINKATYTHTHTHTHTHSHLSTLERERESYTHTHTHTHTCLHQREREREREGYTH